jgi:hypothetical protein
MQLLSQVFFSFLEKKKRKRYGRKEKDPTFHGMGKLDDKEEHQKVISAF